MNRLSIFLVVAVAASAVTARSSSSDDAFGSRLQAGEAALPKNDVAKTIARIAGAYHQELKIDGEVLLEDDLQIEASAPGRIRFSVERKSHEGGGASCGLDGEAAYQDGRFVFTDENAPMISGTRCVMEIRLESAGLRLVDNGTCRDYCGVALELSNTRFPYHGRRARTP